MCTRNWVCGVMLFLVLFFAVSPVLAQGTAPNPDTPDPILEMLDAMPPEMKVGQLLLVSFPGVDVEIDSEIASLIRDYGVGGVLLRPANGNFGSGKLSPSDLISMTNRLQSYAGDAATHLAQVLTDEVLPTTVEPTYVPLLIAVESDEGGIPVTRFVSDTTSLPTLMALGASWDTSLTEGVGTVLGRELHALGVNLLLGPDLDVLSTPRPGSAADLGTSSFGGDPFWVGELGKAYIRGLHTGGEGGLLVSARHFPGLGSADRILAEEVPTVQQPLEQLKQVELMPFFAVAESAPGAVDAADAFLVTHVRYSGFQGIIRPTTRPLSLDAQLQSVMEYEEIAPWRQAGGVLIADNLALRSIHRIGGLSFNARRVTQDALSAGNDLLVLDRFAVDESWSGHFSNIRDTLDFLAGRYATDSTFKALVDAAVYRVLSMKMRIYPDFSLGQTLVDLEAAEQVFAVEGSEFNAQVAMQALTLVFPLSGGLLPSPPQKEERVVIFTQERTNQISLMATDALERAILRFYGTEGTEVVRLGYVRSFSFADLAVALDALPAGVETAGRVVSPTVVLNALEDARWVVFSATGLNPSDPYAQALRSYLANPAGPPDTRLVVFSFGPPYELDSTEVSKLDLYYALYSPGQAFVEAAARALFGDIVAPGSSPVDIPALNYSILSRTMPDPDYVISLGLVDAAGEPLTSTENIFMGDVIHLRTGVILDQNGHTVPNGTSVEFILSYPQEGNMRYVVAETHAGVAEAAVSLNRAGSMVITAQSGPAVSSSRLELTVREGDGAVTVTVIEPTPTPTPTPTSTPSPTPTPVVTETPISNPPRARRLPDPVHLPVPRGGHLLLWELVSVLLVWSAGFFWTRSRRFDVVSATRIAFFGSIGSLCCYIFLVLVGRWGVPAWQYRFTGREFIVGIVSTLVGGGVLAGLAAYYELELRRSSITA